MSAMRHVQVHVKLPSRQDARSQGSRGDTTWKHIGSSSRIQFFLNEPEAYEDNVAEAKFDEVSVLFVFYYSPMLHSLQRQVQAVRAEALDAARSAVLSSVIE
jgi:hypothetical protein